MSVVSKNLYELLGNDPELDPERRTPDVPTKAIDKPLARTGKRNAPAEPPAQSGVATSRPKETRSANENAFRDRGVGSDKNRSRGSGVPGETGEVRRGEFGRGRGARRGRGRGYAAQGLDRHSRTGIAEHEKQAAHGWGAQDGPSELADEKAGEAIAKADEKDEAAIAEPTEEAEPEPEDNSKSYAAYLAELAEKKLSLAAQNIRKPNEGSSAKFPEGKPLEKTEEEAFIAGSGGKAKRERERKTKEFVQLDDEKLHREAPRESFRGRGRGRGGETRGRGEGRGRGGRGRGEARGGPRGGRPSQAAPSVADTSAFPSLGA